MVPENNWLTECIDEALLMVDRSGIVTFRNSLAQDLYRRLGYIEDILGQPYENVRLVEQDGNSEECSGYSYVETTVSNLVLDIKHIQLNSAGAAFAVIIQDVTWRREQEQALILKVCGHQGDPPPGEEQPPDHCQPPAPTDAPHRQRGDAAGAGGEHEPDSLHCQHPRAAGSERCGRGHAGGGHPEHKEQYHAVFSNPKCYVTITMEGGDFQVDSDIATSVAIIINELLQNSLKYAFQDRSSGEIRIVVEQGKLYSSIQVSDNGGGFDVANTEGNRLGLSIVQTLVKDKLRGNLEIESGPEGTCARFDFKNQIIGTADVT